MARPARPLRHVSDEQLYCGMFNHVWEDVTGIADPGPHRRTNIAGVLSIERCASCADERRRVLVPWNGRVNAATYRHSEFYMHIDDDPTGEMTRKEQIRREYMLRRG